MMHRRRSAFTLLEVLLASLIAVMLMSALYVAVDIQIRQARNAREIIEQSTLARALLTRMAADITPTLASPLPDTSGTSSSATGTGQATSGSATGGSGTTDASATAQQTSGTTTASTVFPLNIGVQGDSTQLTVSMSRVPKEAFQATDTGEIVLASDLRRVLWWLSANGLSRHEYRVATADEALTLPVDLGDDPMYVIAEEVRSIQFQYFDGTQWLDSWDGSLIAEGATSPMGPPLLISIRVGIGPPGVPEPPEDQIKYFRHVVALPTANGLPSDTSQTTTTTMP